MNHRSWGDRLGQFRQSLTANQSLDFRLLSWAALVGFLTGGIGTYLHLGVEAILAQRERLANFLVPYPWLYWTVPCLVTMAMVGLSFTLMRRFAPETSGSGIPQIEGRLMGWFPFHWQRILPVKFFGGILSLGSGMAVGFEGPTIQIGGSVGHMISQWCRADAEQTRILIAAGAGAGLTSAFNAPLAGILFITEEVSPHFDCWPLAYRAVIVASTIATMVERSLRGQNAVIALTKFDRVPLESLWMFVLLGIFFGLIGYLFNRYLLQTLQWFSQLPPLLYRLTGLWVGAVIGFLSLLPIPLTGSGETVVLWAFNSQAPGHVLLSVFLLRFALTLFCYGSGAIGGIFAPMLAIATIGSLGIARELHLWFPTQIPHPGALGLAGMGALVAATVQAPLTAILLTIEMTDNFFVILPLLVTCLVSTMVAQGLGCRPIYTLLQERLKQHPRHSHHS